MTHYYKTGKMSDRAKKSPNKDKAHKGGNLATGTSQNLSETGSGSQQVDKGKEHRDIGQIHRNPNARTGLH